MSLALNELLICCRGLEHERATERKKEVERFKRLLRDPETVRELDRASACRASRQLTWDAVFRFLKKYLQKETELLQAGKANVSASTQAGRQKKMQEISSLMKYFIRCANKRGPKLKCTELLSHVVEVVQSSFACAAYGEDCSSILLKDVLSVRKYWCEITLQQWEGLMDLYCGLFTGPSTSINRVLLSRIIYVLVQGCCLQTQGLSNTLFSFFSRALSNARVEKQLTVLQHLITALNVFLRSAATSSRRRVCRLGEELLPSLLYVWSQMRPGSALKQEMVEFFSLQLCVHHPRGAKTPETGALAEDWVRWHSLLYSLDDVLVAELSHIGSRGKYATGCRHVAAKENLVQLVADICHQLFDRHLQVLEVGGPHPDGPQWCKRRRVEFSWDTLRDRLLPHHSDFDIIPWLQVTAALISKYTSTLPDRELPPLLSLLCQLLGEQRHHGDRGPYVLRCLRQVALCQAARSGKSQAGLRDLGRLWGRVWTLALRGVSAAQTEALCLDLLATMVQGSLAPVDREFWKLFSGAVCKPSIVSTLCLAQAMCSCSIPKSIYSREEWSSSSSSSSSSSPPVLLEADGPSGLKESIMDWFLMKDHSDDVDDGFRHHLVISSDFPLNLIPRVLVALVLKDSASGLRFLMGSDQLHHFYSSDQPVLESSGILREIQDLYLQFSFDDTACHSVAVDDRSRACWEIPQLTVVCPLRNRLEQGLQEMASHLLNSPTDTASPVHILRGLMLLTGVLGAFITIGLLTEDDVCQNPLFQKAKALAQDFSEAVMMCKTRLSEAEHLTSLRSVMLLCSECLSWEKKDSVSTVSRSILMKTFPARLLTELSDTCKVMLSSLGKSSAGRGENDAVDDLEVSRTQAEENQAEEVDLFDDGDRAHPSTSGTQKPKGDDSQHALRAQSPLCEDHLCEQDLALLAVLRFLCVCVCAQQERGVAFKVQDMRRRFLKLLEVLDGARPLHLHAYLLLLKELPAEQTSLTPEELTLLLKPLSDVCSLHRQDHEVCSYILMALLPCVHYLSRPQRPPVESDEMDHVRGILLKVISGFCILGKMGKSTPAVRAAVGHCLRALLEADPCCEWAVLSLNEKEVPVCVVLPSLLADPHHGVRMLAATTVERLFLEKPVKGGEQKKMLPLKHQQEAFEKIYLKAQKGVSSQRDVTPEDLPDETFNRRSTLLKSLSVVMCCSPVCEKQALFALVQSHKENTIEEPLVKKVLTAVSRTLAYKSAEQFVRAHLYYLVAEWLTQRQKDPGYRLQSFPYTLLGCCSLEEFYRSSYHVLIPHLVFLNDFEEVKCVSRLLGQDWRRLLADCFPKIMVNILPHFALPQDCSNTGQREQAHRVYNLLKDSDCLGKQQIDALICGNLADIVVELLKTLYEGTESGPADAGELQRFTGELDPAPNPPCFSSRVIKATLDYLSRCHSSSHRSLVAILSKTPMSMQKILFCLCQCESDTTNTYERHRVIMMYSLFVKLLLPEVKDGLGGAWAFVLRDIIYTLMHHINGRSARQDEVSVRSSALCCDLLTTVCHTAVRFCDDALESHLQVIVGTLTAQVSEQPAVTQQVLSLLRYLVIDNPDNTYLREAVPFLEPFPDQPAFRELRAAQHALKYSSRVFTLRQEIEHFLSVKSCDSLPLTRLEGLKDLKGQMSNHKQQIKQLLKECHADPSDSVLVQLLGSLLQLCKLASNHPGGRDMLEAVGSCLGELGPVDLSTIALHHGKEQIFSQAAALYPEAVHQWVFIILRGMDKALTHHSIAVRQAAAVCLKDILACQAGLEFWEKNHQDPMMLYLSPFRTSKKRKVQSEQEEATATCVELLDSADLWSVQPGEQRDWLHRLCRALLRCGGIQNEALLKTTPLCEVNTDFCQWMLPLFFHNVLLRDQSGSWRRSLSTHVQSFFSSCCRPADPSPTTPLPPASGETGGVCPTPPDKWSLRTMLTVIDYLRHQPRPLSPGCSEYGTVCESNFWLDLNYLVVARAAQVCAAHFTALLYCEIHVDHMRTRKEESRRAQSRTSRRITFEDSCQNSMCEEGVEDVGISLQEILMEAYRSIGEPDSLYGCGGDHLINPLTRIRTYEHEALWEKVLSSYDLRSDLPEVTRQVGIVEGLQKLGLYGVLSVYLQGLERQGSEYSTNLRELRFQAAWRSSQWDTDLAGRSEELDPCFNESVFTALQGLKDKDFSLFEQTLTYARRSCVEEVCRDSLEVLSSLYPALRNLQMIEELESVKQLFSGPVTTSSLDQVYQKWNQHLDLLTDSDFSLVEPILALRSSLHEMLLKCETDPDRMSCLSSAYTSHLMELCRLACSAGNTQLAERAVFQVRQCGTTGLGPVTHWSWQLEEAQVFWEKKEAPLALGLLTHMIHTLEKQPDPAVVLVYAECLRLCGSWLGETCRESPAVILKTYLERAVEVLVDHGGVSDPKLQGQKMQAFLSLARFSDAQYQSIENYMSSSEFENKQALLENARKEVDLMRERKVTNNRYTVKVQRELELDQRALSSLRADRGRFLLKAVENYVRCLELGEEHDSWVFRLASLWLENADVREVNAVVEEGVRKIPSYKFLPLMYQLAARMGRMPGAVPLDDGNFHGVLTELICRSSVDHPHHTLFIILALVNANKDENFSRSRLSKSGAKPPSPLDTERAEVALTVLNRVRQEKPSMIRNMEVLCSAYITLAYMDASRHKTEKKAIPIPPEQPIMQIKDLDDVIIPTMDIRVDPSGKYEDLVTIRCFSPSFHLAGGVNLPKIIDCVGSDGRSRKQLVKGQDDLRQDAVMQQVFHMCSSLLQRNSDTRKRKLNIRRYKVVPFSQRSGVLEWCSGTTPIGEFLVDPQKGAHKRFRPQDWNNLSCRKKMMEAQRLESDSKLQAFAEVCQNFRPVFRYFCMEKFRDAAVWMEKRLAYTRSVATSSIVGYIVGLGDRHIQNILIDEQTAELVHIDLGVAFEQGKILPTPETVPFRLSRDIVDGMGISGVEGVFRRCCEKTMDVMRNSQEVLLTIVEVLLYDPLFDWTMNPLKAFYLQQQDEQAELNPTLNPTLEPRAGDSQSFNKVAERVLLRLQEKLKGVEEGAVLSVDGQVNLLIQQAMDPKNLSRLFPGWQAWV